MQDLEKRKSHLLTVMMMIEADNSEHKFESNLAYNIGKRLGFTPEEVDELKNNPTNVSYDFPKTEVARMTILYDVFFIMKIDGNINQEEQKLFISLGRLLGFNDMMLDEFLDVAKKYVGQVIPDDTLLNIIKKYMN